MNRICSINGNSQRLDGGAMFGHVPREVWSQWLKPDDSNRVPLACRAMLIQEDERNILLETGIGAFFEPKLRERYGVVEKKHVLLDSLKQAGLTHEDIDIVVLSHLHFDHAGGLLSAWKKGAQPELLFPKAKFVVSKLAWQRSINPHVRDSASFIPELNDLLESSGRLELVEDDKSELLGEDYHFFYSNGHTPGLMHTIFHDREKPPIIFASDLIPGSHWVHLPVTMGYDRAPELLIDEKRALLDYAVEKKAQLFYTHDPRIVTSAVKCNDKGKYIPVEMLLDEDAVNEV